MQRRELDSVYLTSRCKELGMGCFQFHYHGASMFTLRVEHQITGLLEYATSCYRRHKIEQE